MDSATSPKTQDTFSEHTCPMPQGSSPSLECMWPDESWRGQRTQQLVERQEYRALVGIRHPRNHAAIHVFRVFILSCCCSWNWNRAYAGFVPHRPRPEADFFTLLRSKSRGRPSLECKLKSSLTFSKNHRPGLKLCLENGRYPDAERDWQGYDSGKDLSEVSSFPDELIRSLDLAPLIQGVASHAGTRRGRQALLALVNENYDKKPKSVNFEMVQSKDSSRARRARFQQEQPPISSTTNSRKTRDYGATRQLEMAPIANSKEAAQKEYDYVEQAALSIVSSSGGSSNIPNVTLPPIYGANSGPQDISTIVDTDDDEWLRLPGQVWTLEHILQAEMIMEKLMQVKKWAMRDSTQTWAPLLSKLGCLIDEEDVLLPIYSEVVGRVEIVRVRSITDPTGKSTFSFRFKADKFPILKLLREKETELVKRGGKTLDQEILEIQNEMEELEEQIRVGCVNQIQSVSAVIDAGWQVVARLDVVFAKAAFGMRLSGQFPEVANEGRIDVGNFIHPVLLMRDLEGSFPGVHSPSLSKVVPINLQLSSNQGDQALIISGPNGGGKTVAMKSFGVVCILCKLGIPIPVSSPKAKGPRVDFFDHILVEAGDQQSVIEGESTWMAKVNAYASILRRVMNSAESSQTSLVILDELGGYTDPDAGSAVSQAVLEHLLAGDKCRIVATTHLPRLKALSYESPLFGCATVLLQRDDSSEYQVPTFQLEYGLIGESYAFGTVSRSRPSMPESVLSRAVELMVGTGEDPKSESGNLSREANYVCALTSSMEEQLHRANKARSASERSEGDSARCRSAMLSLAAAYENQLAMLERRVEDCYQTLRSHKKDEVEILGDTLASLRVAKKKIKSQQDLLRERGLRVLPVSYKLVSGESVVIVAPGEWDGATAQVLANGAQDKTLSPIEVLVQPSSAFNAADDVYPPLCDPMVFQRHELAIWDFASVWKDDGIEGSTYISIPDSRRKLSSLLSTLKTKEAISSVERGDDKSKRADSFRSSRARKAAAKTRKKSKN